MWPAIAFALSEPGPAGHGSGLWDTTRVEELPGWNKQPEEVRAAIRSAARAYLLHHTPELPPLRQTNFALHSVVLALTLWLDQLESDADLRARFSPVWVEAVLRTLYPTREPLPQLLSVLYRIEPALTLKVCLEDLERMWSENSSLVAEHLNGIWSPAFRDGVAALLRKTPLQPETYATGLTWLAARERAFAANLALERLHEHAAAPAIRSQTRCDRPLPVSFSRTLASRMATSGCRPRGRHPNDPRRRQRLLLAFLEGRTFSAKRDNCLNFSLSCIPGRLTRAKETNGPLFARL